MLEPAGIESDRVLLTWRVEIILEFSVVFEAILGVGRRAQLAFTVELFDAEVSNCCTLS